MKLNPPASSSDLESAREIARRLHQRRRRADFDRAEPARASLAPFPATPTRTAGGPGPTASSGTPTPGGASGAARATGPATDAELGPPSWDEGEAEDATTAEGHLAAALDDLTDGGDDEGSGDAFEPPTEPDLPGVDVEDDSGAGVSPDEMVGTTGSTDVGDGGTLEEPLADSMFDAQGAAEGGEDAVAALGSTEELFDEPPPPPSWDDVVETCREAAGASGAMIIDPAGQVFAARGDWPDPGPDAIAGRLVAMMERTLKDAPTRSVSAPVGGQHLTAWRVPLAEGLVTAAFIADTPLRSDVRAAIDAEIRRGAGA